MDKQRRNRLNLQKEATLGFCLKDVDDFASSVEDKTWKCPFCKDYSLKVPSQEEYEAWKKCGVYINAHLSAHRSSLLQKVSPEDLVNYEKHKGNNRARVWVSGTMKDRGYQ